MIYWITGAAFLVVCCTAGPSVAFSTLVICVMLEVLR